MIAQSVGHSVDVKSKSIEARLRVAELSLKKLLKKQIGLSGFWERRSVSRTVVACRNCTARINLSLLK